MENITGCSGAAQNVRSLAADGYNRSIRGSLIDLPLTTKLGHKIQNPVLHLFRVTGFLGDRGPFQILFSLSGAEKRRSLYQ